MPKLTKEETDFLNLVAAHMKTEKMELTPDNIIEAMQAILGRQKELCNDSGIFDALAEAVYDESRKGDNAKG